MREDEQYHIQKFVNSGSQASARHLVEKYQNSLFTLCYRIIRDRELAEEAAQDSFVKCFRSLNKIKNRGSFKSWLYKIGYRTAIDYTRRIHLVPEQLESAGDVLSKMNNQPEPALLQNEKREILEKVISELGPDEQAVIQLYYMEDLPVKEIGGIIGLSTSNVKIKLMRSRKYLHERLLELFQGEIENLL